MNELFFSEKRNQWIKTTTDLRPITLLTCGEMWYSMNFGARIDSLFFDEVSKKLKKLRKSLEKPVNIEWTTFKQVLILGEMNETEIAKVGLIYSRSKSWKELFTEMYAKDRLLFRNTKLIYKWILMLGGPVFVESYTWVISKADIEEYPITIEIKEDANPKKGGDKALLNALMKKKNEFVMLIPEGAV
jgi:hypothetical protein